jgi:uncharacterized protein (TIGR01244 family)
MIDGLEARTMRHVLAAALVAALATTMSAQTKQPYPGVSNFTRVDAVVACGGATETSALDQLKKDGFKSVINLRQASEPNVNLEANQAKAKELGLGYFHIPVNGASPDPASVDTFLATVSKTANQPVFIHCASANRVGMMWLVKRVMQDGYTVEKATTEAKAIGLSAAPLEKFALDYIASHKK